MSNSNLFFDFEKPTKWKWNLILVILFLSLTAFINSQNVYISDMFSGLDDNVVASLNNFIIIASIFFILLKNAFFILCHLVLFVIVSKFSNNYIETKNIFSSTILLFLTTSFLHLLVSLIQYLFKINTNDYNIGSLNILDKGNHYLASFDFVHLISSYIVFQILYKTLLVSKRLSVIITIFYCLLILLFRILLIYI